MWLNLLLVELRAIAAYHVVGSTSRPHIVRFSWLWTPDNLLSCTYRHVDLMRSFLMENCLFTSVDTIIVNGCHSDRAVDMLVVKLDLNSAKPCICSATFHGCASLWLYDRSHSFIDWRTKINCSGHVVSSSALSPLCGSSLVDEIFSWILSDPSVLSYRSHARDVC